MSCIRPYSIFLDINNKRVDPDLFWKAQRLTRGSFSKFNIPPFAMKVIETGCYTCSLCKKRRLDDWFIRCICEAKYHKKICFLTLTYNNENLPEKNKLSYDDICKFFKRLRKNSNRKIRYFMCGEYGSKRQRPHYHAVIFGLDSSDRGLIDRSWNKGFIDVGCFSPGSLRYTMKYFLKTLEVRSGEDKKHYDEKFFCYSSRNPGLGYQYLLDNYKKLSSQGYILYRGRKYWLPKYFISKIKNEDFDSKAYLEFARSRWLDFTDKLCKHHSIKVNPFYYEKIPFGHRDAFDALFLENGEYDEEIYGSSFYHFLDKSLLTESEYNFYLRKVSDILSDMDKARDLEYNARAKLKKRKFYG